MHARVAMGRRLRSSAVRRAHQLCLLTGAARFYTNNLDVDVGEGESPPVKWAAWKTHAYDKVNRMHNRIGKGGKVTRERSG